MPVEPVPPPRPEEVAPNAEDSISSEAETDAPQFAVDQGQELDASRPETAKPEDVTDQPETTGNPIEDAVAPIHQAPAYVKALVVAGLIFLLLVVLLIAGAALQSD